MTRQRPVIHRNLVELLSEFGDRGIAEQEALNLRAAMLAQSDGYLLSEGEDGLRAEPQQPRSGSVGKDLRRLATVARRTRRGQISRKDWAHTWAAQSRSVRRACRPYLLREGSRSLDPGKLLPNIYADGVNILIPAPEAILDAIDAFLQIDAAERQRHRHDPGARIVMTALRTAYTALTGKPARGRGRGVDGEQPSAFIQFGRKVEALFGTHVLPNADSTRLRRNFGDK
ncbi:hypothetical protein BKD09_01430 [Bradyrhizobium japonicum]|uniref:Uncharacterized protein n=1 Tax=Bradyrhizobium japonicum TaxID=375 RepID=A0A1L3F0Z3_BRAJP|nr:hypothetical protein [Bradyrhizobium japonicum]APG06978.1 hypothetical protein BKD09_01430 [Bradyrhizobium japonicum]